MNVLLAFSILFASITKEEIVKLSQDGVSDDTIIAKIRQDRSAFRLSADEILELKKAGVSDRVVQAMLGSFTSKEGKGLEIENRSHRGVRVYVDPENRAIHFLDQGDEIEKKTTVEFEAPDGVYQVHINGRKTSYKVTTPVKLTIRGNDVTEMEVLTAYVGAGKSAKTFLILAREK